MQRTKALKVSSGFESDADLGPMITPDVGSVCSRFLRVSCSRYASFLFIQAKARAEELIQSGVEEGAHLLLDGRGLRVQKFPGGNFVGPTILSGVQTSMRCYSRFKVEVSIYAKRHSNASSFLNYIPSRGDFRTGTGDPARRDARRRH